MKSSIIKFDIGNELDIILAHKRASQICNLTGIGLSGRTCFVTAISEICRNTLEHAGSGQIDFSVDPDASRVNASITDNGPGINDLDSILSKPLSPGVKGCGLLYSKKLVDFFAIQTSSSGTTVSLGMRINSKSIPLNKTILAGWTQYFEKEIPVSPYEEIKKQNMQLLEITEQLRMKNLEAENQLEQIKTLNIQLNKANKELEDFAYTISHDLKGPINNLKLLLSLIEKAKNPEQKDEYIKEFNKLINRLNHILSGLVQIMDLQNTQGNIAKSVAFEDILNVIQEEHKSKFEEISARIEYNFNTVPTIFYYEVHLYSILSNLINNSIKYREVEKEPFINISTSFESDYILLKVQDNGIGMDMSKVSKDIFKPFRRFSNSRDGKGIGLHLVKSMVEKNGGKIEVESEPGKGSTFYVYLKPYMDIESAIGEG
jgi:signal transduction histidine kinase